MNQPKHRWAVLLAGGDGIRLRELTRRIAGDSRPKQFCRLVGGQTLFAQTVARLEPVFPQQRHVAVFTRAHQQYFTESAGEFVEASSLAQPTNRGTGIAIGLALIHILRRDPNALIGFFPCDHYYANDDSSGKQFDPQRSVPRGIPIRSCWSALSPNTDRSSPVRSSPRTLTPPCTA